MADDSEEVALFSRGNHPSYTAETPTAETPASTGNTDFPPSEPATLAQGEPLTGAPPGSPPKDTKPNLEELFGNVNEQALLVCGFGRLQWMLLAVTGFAFMGDMVELMVLAFVMPSAERDLCMDDPMKGWIGATTFAGMMVGGPFWGFLSDKIGRRSSLLTAMLVGSTAAIVAAFVPVYWMFLICRLITGFGVGGSIPITFTYMGEFCIRGRRGLHMGLMMTFWVMGGIFVAGCGWLVIPSQDLQFSIGESTFLSWRVFLLICALPMVLAVFGLLIMPESPRFLLQAGRDLEALAVYRRIYRWNHMEAGSDYEMPEIELPAIPRTLDIDEVSNESTCSKLLRNMENFWGSFFQLFSAPLAPITFLLAIIWFTTCFTYYGLTIWFPEYMKKLQQDAYFAKRVTINNDSISYITLSGIIENRNYVETNFTNVSFADAIFTHVTFTRCFFSQCLFSNVTSRKSSFVDSMISFSIFNNTDFWDYKFVNTPIVNTSNLNLKEGCQVDFDINYSERKVYFDTLLGQVASLPASLISAVIMDKVGRVKLIGSMLLVSAVSVFCIWFTNTEPAVIAMNCVFEAFFIVGWNALDVLSAESYPTILRSTGVGFLSFLSRIAASLGNVAFAQLIAVDKAIPILICAAVCAVGGLVSFKVPDTTNKVM